MPGRWCDRCRALGLETKALATHARDNATGGTDFYCDEHLPEGA